MSKIRRFVAGVLESASDFVRNKDSDTGLSVPPPFGWEYSKSKGRAKGGYMPIIEIKHKKTGKVMAICTPVE